MATIKHCVILKYIKNMIKNDFGTKKFGMLMMAQKDRTEWNEYLY